MRSSVGPVPHAVASHMTMWAANHVTARCAGLPGLRCRSLELPELWCPKYRETETMVQLQIGRLRAPQQWWHLICADRLSSQLNDEKLRAFFENAVAGVSSRMPTVRRLLLFRTRAVRVCHRQ